MHSKALLLSVLVAAVAAIPAPPYRPARRPLASRAAAPSPSAADLATFAFFAEWAGAAYCNSERPVGSVVACVESVCPTVHGHGATIVANLGTSAPSSETGMLGFVAYDPAANQVVVSYRGSASIRNFLDDVAFAQIDCGLYLTPALASSIGGGCKLHQGFGEAWVGLRDATFAGITAARATSAAAARAPIVVTGHSLGGAVATLAAAELRHRGIAVDLYTYGSPRVGNEALAAFLSTQGPTGSTASTGVSHNRITHADDPVPQLPPIILLDYAHTSPEYWLSGAGTLTASGEIKYATSDVTVCTGYESYDCNGGELSLDVPAHLVYFVYISGCNTEVLTLKERDPGPALPGGNKTETRRGQ